MKSIIDNFGNKLFLQNKNAEELYEYISQNFDMNEETISNKLFHTFRVADACKEVAKKLNLDEELAYNIGLLHDYGRFSQWERFHSFNDHKTVDHADESVRVLFDEEEITKFNLNESDYNIIKLAIKNHNKKEIELGDDSTLLLDYCKLIRDCDKIDIVYRISRGNIKVTETGEGVSPQVLESFKNHQCVDKKYAVSPLDNILTLIAYIYDFNFKETLSYINFEEYWKGIEEFYLPLLSKNDQQILLDNIGIIKAYINERLSSQDENS